MEVIRNQPRKDGLVPIFLSPDSGSFIMSEIRLGSRGDSYYEYLMKQYLQTGRTEVVYKEMHDEAMAGIKQHLLRQSATRNLMITTELMPRRSREGMWVPCVSVNMRYRQAELALLPPPA